MKIQKLDKPAFTFVELIVVTSILVLVSVSSVFYFSGFIDNYKLKSEIGLIKNNIDDFDNKVRNKQSYDYEMHFKTWEWFFTTYQNIFDIDNYATGVFNNWTWTLSIEPTLTWALWQIKIYNDYKTLFENMLQADNDITYNFDQYTYYKIIWYLWNNRINDLFLNYYSPDNLSFDSDLSLLLSDINTSSDKNWTVVADLVVKNVWWRKEFYNWITKVDSESIYLFFEKQGAEGVIEIKK